MLGRTTLSIALLALLTVGRPAYADEQRNDAIVGGALDCASTIVAVEGYNLIEKNPLGKFGYALPACALKPVGIFISEQLSEPARTQSLTVQSALWTGASANNITLVAAKILHAAGLLSSAATGPVGPLVGIAVAGYVWHKEAPRREFAEICAFERRTDPNVVCVYTPPA